MKKLKLFIAALALLGGVTLANADDVFKDVTSTYLKNADFEGEYTVQSNTGVSSNRAIYKPDGWTVSYKNGQVNDCSALNNECMQWSFFSGYSQLSTGGKNTYWIRLHKDKSNQELELSQTVNLPLGSYKLSADYLKAESGGDGYIFVNSTTQNGTSNNQWITVYINFTSDGSNATKLGCRAVHTNSYHKIYAFDNFKLEWNLTQSLQFLLDEANAFYTENGSSYTALKAVIDDTDVSETNPDELESQYNALAAALDLAKNHRKPWLDAWTTANTNFGSNDYANVIGEEKTALEDELAKVEPTTAQGYDDAKVLLVSANNTFTAAKASYDALVSEIAYAQTIGVTAEEANDYAATSTSTAATVLTSTQELKVVEYNLVNTNYPNDVTELLGTWNGGNYETQNNAGFKESESYFNKWNGSSMSLSSSATVTLPAGAYALKVAGRGNSTMNLSVQVGDAAAVSTPFLMIGDTGRGIDTSGETNFSEEGTYTNNNNGYGWQYRYITFNVPEGGSDVTITISGQINNSWQSFYAPVLLTNDDAFLSMCLAELDGALTAASIAPNEVSSLLTTIARTADQNAADVTYQSVVGGSEAAALSTAIANANSVDRTNVTAVQSATNALTEATEAYNTAKPAYERAAMVIAIGGALANNLVSLVANPETTAADVEEAANTKISSVVNLALVMYNNKTLGFEKDEYAPYNNVQGLQLLAEGTTMAGNPANYNNEEFYERFLEIKEYTWTKNAEEVNAIAGGAELDSYTHSGNYDIPNGWTNTGYNTRIVGISESLVGNNPGLAGVTNSRAMLLKYGTTYGEKDGYTLPLKANTVYKFSFTYGLWDEDGEIKKDLSVTSPEGNTIKMIPSRVSKKEGSKDNCANKLTTAWYEFETWFKTAEAGNYVLNITNTDGNEQRQMVFAELDLRKAIPTDITISESDTEAPAYSYSNVTLTRTLSASYWNTFSVPFDMDIPSGWDVKEFDSVDDVDENVIIFKNAESIVAGNPYLVKPESDVVNPTYNGVVVVSTEGETMGTGDYQFAAQIYNKSLATDGTIAYLSTDGTIKKLTSGGIKGLRAYFIIPAEGNARIAFTDGDQTGIKDTVRETTNDNRVYDLQGRQVKAVKKGIYVVNGKKVIK